MRPDQYVPVSPPGIQPGSQTGVVRARQVIVSSASTGGGVFVYSGTPALGNPPIDYMSASATDPFGNVLPQAGTVAFVSSSIWAALTGGQLLFGDGTTLASVGGNTRWETAGAVAIVMNNGTGEIDLDPISTLRTNGNSITGLFGNLDPSGLPLSGSATLGAVIAAVNSMLPPWIVMVWCVTLDAGRGDRTGTAVEAVAAGGSGVGRRDCASASAGMSSVAIASIIIRRMRIPPCSRVNLPCTHRREQTARLLRNRSRCRRDRDAVHPHHLLPGI